MEYREVRIVAACLIIREVIRADGNDPSTYETWAIRAAAIEWLNQDCPLSEGVEPWGNA